LGYRSSWFRGGSAGALGGITRLALNQKHTMTIKSTDELLDKAQDNMRKASNSDTLDQTVYYSNQAVVLMLNAVVLELREIRKEVSQSSS
jgi:hypothetical protein